MEKKELLKNLSVFKNNIHIQNFSNKIINYDDKTLYFGTGLASCHESSIGFGIEILCTILTALWLKEKYGLTQVIHEISTIGYNISEENKKKLIVSEKKIIENMIKNLSLENDYKLNFSHEYHESEEFNDIKKFVTEKLKEFWANEKFSEIGNYTILQISGMKYLYENYNTRIKLGWITDKKAPLSDVTSNDINKLINESHLNEYYFDQDGNKVTGEYQINGYTYYFSEEGIFDKWIKHYKRKGHYIL